MAGIISYVPLNTEAQLVARPRFNVLEVFLVLVIVFMVFRLTVADLLVVLVLLYLLFPLHRSRRALLAASALLALAVLIPVDVYVPGLHGPVVHSKHNGPRFVQVLYGLGARPGDGGEAIWGGCVVGVHDTRWRLVWD